MKLTISIVFIILLAAGAAVTALRAKQKPVRQQVSELEETVNRVGLTLPEQ
jgi:hypothetical protein